MSYATVGELFTAICDEIRNKKGSSEQIEHQNIPSEISNIETGGETLDWSNIKDMSYAFYGSGSIFRLVAPTIKCDMSQVTDWSYAFYEILGQTANRDVFNELNLTFNRLDKYQFYEGSSLTNIQFNDVITSNDMSYALNMCTHISCSKIVEILNKLSLDNTTNMTYTFYQLGLANSNEYGTCTMGDVTVNTSRFSNTFKQVHGLKSVGNITNIYTGITSCDSMFYECGYIQEVGTITTPKLSTSSYNLFYNCKKLKKIGGFNLTEQTSEILTSSGSKFLGRTNFTDLEEILNIPIVFFRYGGTNIGNLAGTSSTSKPLSRLTFSSSDQGYITKNYAKNIDISYCSFDKTGMVEMFDSLPDATEVTGTKVITIKGNPCVTDGTLTDEDIAIATSKGYTLATE